MFSPGRVPLSPTGMSSVPLGVELSHIHNQDSIDEKHQPGVVNCDQDEEQGPEHKTIKIELKRYHPDFSSCETNLKKRPKSNFATTKSQAYNHKSNPTVIAIKKWYQIRGWSLLYPFIVSLYLAISELEFDLRTMGYAFIASSCVFCLLHMKNFESQKNLVFTLLSILCILVVLGDFLFQFSIIGDQGWAATGSYQSCYNFAGLVRNKELHDKFCNIFKTAYYLNSLVYLTTISSFAVYLLGTSKLLKLVNHGGDGNGYRTKLEDEVDLDLDD